ncbi:hypothetical protein J6590_043895 [Homalodisca vitripennis]|nr:hypothetical protein J6590_043895 [Homalodisca vitripennis]
MHILSIMSTSTLHFSLQSTNGSPPNKNVALFVPNKHCIFRLLIQLYIPFSIKIENNDQGQICTHPLQSFPHTSNPLSGLTAKLLVLFKIITLIKQFIKAKSDSAHYHYEEDAMVFRCHWEFFVGKLYSYV